MTFEEIEEAYERLCAIVPSVASTFRECSKDDNSGADPIYLVNSSEPCYDFDRVKLHYFKSGKSSVDSLLLVAHSQALYFIEFKNSRYKNFFESIPAKAEDSLCIHQCVCNGNDISNQSNVFALVMSTEKNPDAITPVSAMMRNAGYFDQPSLLSSLSNELKEAFETRCNGTPYAGNYLRFIVILSNDFDSFVSAITKH